MAAVLDIDMGNTRTKWRSGGEHGALPAPQLPTLQTPPCRVRVATVLRNQDEIAAAVRHRYGVGAEFAATAACLGGVRCGYREPERLGVDRWLALVAAWRQVRTDTVVVGAGTAVTVDFVQANGRHEGGYIAPGLGLMRDALTQRTANIRLSSSASAADACGHEVPSDTTSAVLAGTATMLVAFAQAAIERFAVRRAAQPTIFVTGGDAARLVDGLARPAQHRPHLVLDGLAIALP